jgi:hypothetical protein
MGLRVCPDDKGSDQHPVLNVTELVDMLRRVKGLEISVIGAAIGATSIAGIWEVENSANRAVIIESVAEEAQSYGRTAAEIEIKGARKFPGPGREITKTTDPSPKGTAKAPIDKNRTATTRVQIFFIGFLSHRFVMLDVEPAAAGSFVTITVCFSLDLWVPARG